MFRTRDFLILCTIVGFLLIAIILTVLRSTTGGVDTETLFNESVNDTTATYTAEAVTPADERENRLNDMRRKLADIVTVLRAPEEDEGVIPPPVVADATTTKDTTATGKIDTCATTRVQTAAFPTTAQSYAEIESQRVFYTNIPDMTDGTSTEITYTKKIALRLPARSQALSFSSCIASPVVAVTLTGLPIANTDYKQYLNLPEGTLIGYTIDGFELYSKSIIATDACGGVSIGGVYRYYLSVDRAGVVGCFMGIPAVL